MNKSILLSIFCAMFLILNGFTNTNSDGDYHGKKEKIPDDIENLLEKNKCLSCHTPYRRLVGPSFVNIAQKQYDAKKIAELIEKPQPDNWPGYPAMAPIKNVPYNEVCKITSWINSLKP